MWKNLKAWAIALTNMLHTTYILLHGDKWLNGHDHGGRDCAVCLPHYKGVIRASYHHYFNISNTLWHPDMFKYVIFIDGYNWPCDHTTPKLKYLHMLLINCPECDCLWAFLTPRWDLVLISSWNTANRWVTFLLYFTHYTNLRSVINGEPDELLCHCRSGFCEPHRFTLNSWINTSTKQKVKLLMKNKF